MKIKLKSNEDLILVRNGEEVEITTSINEISGQAQTVASELDEHCKSESHMTATEKENLDSLATNIAVLSAITPESIIDWDAASSDEHTHANKSVLDGITSTKVDNWDTAYTNNHTHSNKSVLDGITATKVSNWDTAATNNHTHDNKATLDAITATSTAINSLTGSVGTMAFQNASSYSSATQVNTALSGKSATGHTHDDRYYTESELTGSSTTVVVAKANSASTVPLAGVTNADDLKAIEALSGTNGLLKKTAANTWALDTNTYSTTASAVTSGVYNSTNQKIELKNAGGTVVSSIDATDFIKDGMISDVSLESKSGTTYLVITWNTDAGVSTTELNIGDIFEADNYYTKSETSGKTEISTALSDKVANSTFNTHSASTVHMTTTEKTNLDSLATNIAAISGITSTKVSNWDTAATNNHTHSNKATLDAITATSTAINSLTGSVGSMAFENTSSYSSATQVNTALSGKSATGHTHDDRYYTESELTSSSTTVVVAKAASATTAAAASSVAWNNVSGKPDSYTPSAHNQASNTITAMTSYSKASAAAAIATGDSLNTAIGKLEKALDGKQASGSYVTTSRKVSTASGLTGGGDLSADRTIGLAATGTSGTYGPTADVTGTEGATIKVPQITTDAYGRVTAVTERTYTSKNSTYTVNNGTFTISGDGTSVASTSANASANSGLNIKAGTNVQIATANSEITISATDTKYDGGTAAILSAGTDTANKLWSGKALKEGGNAIWQAKGSYLTGTTKYASSSTQGGAATSAEKLTNTSAIGSVTNPVFFTANGVPSACTYSLNKTVPADAVFTDTNTKVTDVGNHYTPTSSATISKSASSTTNATWGSSDFVTGITLYKDAAGHITDMAVASLQLPANPNSDVKVAQASANTNGNFPIIIKNTNNNTAETAATKFATGVTINPSTNTITATDFIGKVNGITPTNNTGTVTKVSTASGLTGGDITTSGTIGLAATGTSGTYGPTADVTGTEGTTIKVPQITTDAYGRVTSVTERTYTSKNSTYTVNNGTFAISGNGASVASTSANASANSGLNIKAGTNVQIATASSEITISATDTKYTAATAAPGKVATNSASGTSTNYARQDHTHGIDLATGDSNGQVKIAGTNVSVKGLGTAAYKAEGYFAGSGHSHTNMVTGSSLTANAIIVGNGGSAIKQSGVAIETTLSSTLDTKIPTSKAIATYVTSQMTSVLTYKGTISSNDTLKNAHKVGDVYVVSSAGTYAGKACEIGDYLIANTARESASTVTNADWDAINGENQVENKSASLADAGSSTTIATVDGTDLTITTPSSWTGIKKVGTVTKVSTGAGLKGGDITSSGTLKAALSSETKSTLSAAAMGSTASRQYAVGLDANGVLSVNIPWTNTNSGYVPTGRTISTASGLTGGGDLSANRTIGLVATGTSGTYGPTADVTGTEGTTIKVPQITTDAYGRVTAVTERTYTSKNSTYTVNNGTFTISGNGASVGSTSANASANTGVNIKAGTNVTITTGSSEITIAATDTNTWRNVKVNGTEKLGTAINTGSLDITSGSTNGTISVAGTDVAVKGLSSMAYQATSSYSSATQVTTALAGKANTATSISTASGLTGGGNLSANRTIGLAATGTSGTYGPTADVTGTEGTTIKIPQITTDAYGRVTSVTERTLTNKNSTYTVNNGTFAISGNGTSVASTSANASANGGVNIKAGSNITITTASSEITIAASQPTVNNGTLSLQANGTTKTTFTANQSGNSSFNITSGSSNGTISVGGVDVAVKGLSSMAYQATSSYSSATQVTTALSGKVPTGRKVSAGTGLSGGGDLTADRTISLATTGTSGTYRKVTTDAYGRVTAGTANQYVANIAVADSANYITEPEIKSVKINGSSTNAASTNNCQIQYDATNKCLKFLFN